MSKTVTIITIIILTLLSGWGDSQGFYHASSVWDKGKFIWSEAMKSTAGYITGTIFFWFAIKFLQEFNIVTPEVQTIGWFAVTIIGVALASGKFFRWERVDQIIALGVIFGIGLLLFRIKG